MVESLCINLQDLGDEQPQGASRIRLMVNWLHASSHDLRCQLSNNARFKEGTAWVVGEQSEQLWSLTRVSGRKSFFYTVDRLLSPKGLLMHVGTFLKHFPLFGVMKEWRHAQRACALPPFLVNFI